MDYYEWSEQISNTCYGEDSKQAEKLYNYQDSQIKLGFKFCCMVILGFLKVDCSIIPLELSL